jgi:hypothetical protein
MKTFKPMCAATLLALSLSITAYADTIPGDSHTPGRNIPAPSDIGSASQEPGDKTGLASSVDGGISFSIFADMLWTLASIF